MRFGLLGPLVVVDDAGRAIDLGGAQPRLVLALLLAAPDRVVTPDAIIDAVWGDDPPPSAAGTLQSYISRLRRGLEPDRTRGAEPTRLRWEPPGYRLRVDEDEVDFLRFERLAGEGRALLNEGRAADARRVLGDALALWRGHAFADHREADFARGIATRLEDRRTAALDDRIAADLALGRHGAVIGELHELIAQHPFQETLRAHLATALYRAGRQADALRSIEDARTTLRDELGLDLSPPLRALERAILDHDLALLGVAPTPVAPSATGSGGPDPRPIDAPTPAADPTGAAAPGAAPPVAAPPVAGRAAPEPSGPERLVGRAAELRALHAVLDEAATATRVVLIEGEPGIGKTRLAEELGREATRRGATVLWGRALEGDASPAFWPWLPPLRTLVAGADDGTPIATELATLLAPGRAPSDPTDAEAARYVLAEAIVELLARHARRRPLVLVLDDIQWADVASLDLLTTVPGRLPDAPLLLVATVRQLEVGRGDALSDALAALTRTPGARRIELRGLTAHDTATLVEQATGHAPDAAAVAAIHRRAEGNPFFATEVARLLASGLAAHEVPSSVRDVVRRRVAQLPSRTAELLQVAAVIGRDIDLDLLVAASGRDLDSCLDDLEPALLHRVLVPGTDLPGTYRFAHALVREAMVSDLSPLKKARVHVRVADALDDTDDNAEIIAEHLWQAAPIGVGRRAAAALERAGQVALRRVAYDAAEDLLARAVQLHRPNSAEPQDQEAELRAIVLHTSVRVAHHGYPALLGTRPLERGKELAAALDRPAELYSLLWAEWAGFDLACEFRRADAVAVDLFARLEHSTSPRERVLGHTAYGISRWHRGDITEAATHLQIARHAATTVPHATAWVLFDRDQVRLATAFAVYVQDISGALDDAEAHYDEIIRAIPGDRYWELIVCNFAASSALSCGDLDRVRRAGERALRADPESISAFWSNALRCYLGSALALQGDLDQGLAMLDDGWARYTAAGMQTNGVTFLSSRAHALAAAGRVDEAATTLDAARRQLERSDERYAEPTLLVADAVLASVTGDAERAAARFAEASALATRQGSHAIAAHARRVAQQAGCRTVDAS